MSFREGTKKEFYERVNRNKRKRNQGRIFQKSNKEIN